MLAATRLSAQQFGPEAGAVPLLSALKRKERAILMQRAKRSAEKRSWTESTLTWRQVTDRQHPCILYDIYMYYIYQTQELFVEIPKDRNEIIPFSRW